MTVISSQRYLDDEIMEEKIAEFKANGTTAITIPVIRSFLQDSDGNELYIMIDMHHRFAAAKELGMQIDFELVEDEMSSYRDIEEENGEAIAKTWYMDSPWYYINNDVDEDLNDVYVW